MIDFEGEDSRQAYHLQGQWDEVPVPHLELLMTSRYQLSSSDVTH
jgi:hypothetical protein